jgi:hypothetical protein
LSFKGEEKSETFLCFILDDSLWTQIKSGFLQREISLSCQSSEFGRFNLLTFLRLIFLVGTLRAALSSSPSSLTLRLILREVFFFRSPPPSASAAPAGGGATASAFSGTDSLLETGDERSMAAAVFPLLLLEWVKE